MNNLILSFLTVLSADAIGICGATLFIYLGRKS